MKKLMSYTEFKEKINENKRIKIVDGIYFNPKDIKFLSDLKIIDNLWKFYNMFFEYAKQSEETKESKTISKFFSKCLKGISKNQKESYEKIVSCMFGDTNVFNYVFHTVPKDMPDYIPENFEDMIYYFQYFKYNFINVVISNRVALIDCSKITERFEIIGNSFSEFFELRASDRYKTVQFPTLLKTFMNYYYKVDDIHVFLDMITQCKIDFSFDMENLISKELLDSIGELKSISFKSSNIINSNDKNKSVNISNITTLDKIFFTIKESIISEHKNSRNVSNSGILKGNLRFDFIFSNNEVKDYCVYSYLEFVSNKADSILNKYYEQNLLNKYNLYELDFLIKLDVLSKKQNKKLYSRNSGTSSENLKTFVSAFVRKVEDIALRKGNKFEDADFLFISNRYLLLYRSFEYLYTCVSSLDLSVCKKFYKDFGCILFTYINDYSLSDSAKTINYLYRSRDYINCLRLKLGLTLGNKLLKNSCYPEITSFDDCNFKIVLERIDVGKSKTEILKDFFDNFVWFEPRFLIYYIGNAILNKDGWIEDVPKKIKKIFETEYKKIKEISGIDLEILGQDTIAKNHNNTVKRNNLISNLNSIASKDKNLSKCIKCYNPIFHYEEDNIISDITNTGSIKDIQLLLLEKGFNKTEEDILNRIQELKVRRGFEKNQKEEYINKVVEVGDVDVAFEEVFGADRTNGSSRGLKIDVAPKVIKILHQNNEELSHKIEELEEKISSIESQTEVKDIVENIEFKNNVEIAVNEYKKSIISKLHDGYISGVLTDKDLKFMTMLLSEN